MLLISYSFPHRRWRHVRLTALLAAVASFGRAANAQSVGASPEPMTLRSLLDSVRVNHPLVLAAASQVRAAEGGRITARTFGNPMLSYQVDQTPFPGGQPLRGLNREAMTTVTLPLEGLYQRGSRVSRSNADVRAASADAMAVRQQTGVAAAAAFYRAALAQVDLATTRELGQWLDTIVVYNRARAKEGAISEAELLRSELERDRTVAGAAMQAAELAQARAALAAFLPGLPARALASAIGFYDGPLPFPIMASPSADSGDAPRPSFTLTPMLMRRPEVLAARARAEASTAGVAVERSMLLRQLGASFGALQTAGSTSMIAGFSLPLPLFDVNRGQVQRADAQRVAAQLQVTQQERLAAAELLGAYDAARGLTERAISFARRDSAGFLARANESRRIALGAYREGAVPLLQVIDAARTWAEARGTYYRLIFAQHQSILALLVADGQDLFATFPTMAPNGAPQR